MNNETVNDLIQSLESAGELSIREQKFLKLAKAYQQLAAENVALKATSDDRRMFIMNGVQLGYIKVPTAETDPALETIRIAVSPQEPTPATDRIVVVIKADGVESGIKTIMTMLNHQAPGVSDAINVLRVHSSELREGADK
ncbi:hypothetical protein [Klebsiella pneumoniae]|uniref:hypothetical protein n=1 Tax=Klebsiella pneumoniae TaxID=573 RepID=UPI0024AF05EC|nr:hypothetical protein [Klebsiella pneumoniae]MDI7002667.1 hypothetical protein [Klebsiella pneumoniae]